MKKDWYDGIPIIEKTDYVDSSHFNINFKVQILEQKRTPYCKLEIAFNPLFGNLMFIDDEVQISELDSASYHYEMWTLSRPLRNENPKVLVIGDGDGGFTKIADAKHIEIVERDKEIMQAGEKYFGAKWSNVKHVHIIPIENFEPKSIDYDVIYLAIDDGFNSASEFEGQLNRIFNWIKPGGRLIAQAGTLLDPKHIDFKKRYQKWAEEKEIDICWRQAYITCYFSYENFFIGIKQG